MREPHFACRRLKLTLADAAAVYIFTGMETSPKEMVAEPSAWGGIAVATLPPDPYDPESP
jgi:hypothetical protein